MLNSGPQEVLQIKSLGLLLLCLIHRFLMAEALLYIVLERLASVTEQQIRKELNLVLGVEAEIRSLTHTLGSIRHVLEDAERRQVEDKSVQGWLEKLKDMAYQMDDVVDEWSTAILRSQIQGDENASMSEKKVSSCFPSPCLCFKQVASRRDIALKIKGIKLHLGAIDSERGRFNFAPNRSEERPQRLITTSAIDISEVCGRDMDIDTILDHVLGRSCPEKFVGLYIISIVGTGGMGKTTLAQLAYNHPEVKAHFDERIWVCVSDPFDPIRVFRSIVEILQKESCNLHDLEALQQKVQTCVRGQKFLIVLDDVWTEDYRLWEQLKNTLNNGVVESRILVTTRKENVVMMMGTTYRHPIQELSPQHAQMLFHQIAFQGERKEKEEELKEIGEKIADKCKGLPLALKTLGNLMRLKNSKEEWEAVLYNQVWKLDVFEIVISPALLLSYYELPPPIKRCFSYCAVFPKDTVIEVDKLIKLWMAQSYLNSNDTRKEMETLGREYFNYLAAGSFFQDFEKDEEGHVIKCKMHDVVHDLAQFLTKNECFNLEDDNKNEGRIDLSFQKSRHATIILRDRAQNCMLTSTIILPESAQNCLSIYKMKNLCTLLLKWESRMIPEVLSNLFRHLTCLRALDLRPNDDMKEFPREVGELIHLRYLNVSSWSMMQSLPETICDLYNLQTLNISGCHCLDALPQAMHKLINLRHLQNSGTARLKGLPRRIGRLNSLWTLDEFIVSDRNDQCKIEDLRHFNNIRGKLKVRGLGEVRNAMEAKTAEMKNKIYLHDLTLNFDLMGRKDVVEALQPPPNLKSLTIIGYGGIEWPNWVMRSSILTQLKNLILSDCQNCSYMPSVGELRLLEMLEIWDMDSVKCLGSEFLGSSSPISFPKLKRLSFNNMKAWEKWEVTEEEEEEEVRSVMPCLCHLEIYNCQNLDGLPDRVLHIKTPLQELVILSSEILRQRYRKDKGEDWHKVSHIPVLKGL